MMIIIMIMILSIWDILSIIQLEGQWKKGPSWGLAVKFLPRRVDVCVNLFSAFNLADLSMISGCD